MSILNPTHLLEQADRLIGSLHAGPPRQVDLRLAISSTYYGLFHLTLTALADEFVGISLRHTQCYALVYRSVDHRALKDLCLIVSKRPPPAKYRSYLSKGGFGHELVTFADTVVTLQDERHRADYDVTARYRTLQARLSVAAGRKGIAAFKASDATSRKTFLTLLLCPPR